MLDLRAVGLAPVNAGGQALQLEAVGLLNVVLVAAVAEIEPPIGSKNRPVEVGAVADGAELADDLRAFAGDALLFIEPPEAGIRGAIQRPIQPADAGGECHLVGEDGGFVEPAVGVRRFEDCDRVSKFLQQLLRVEVLAGVLGEEEAAGVVEAAVQRVLHQRRSGDALDDEAVGNVEDALGGGITLFLGGLRIGVSAAEGERDGQDEKQSPGCTGHGTALLRVGTSKSARRWAKPTLHLPARRGVCQRKVGVLHFEKGAGFSPVLRPGCRLR